MNRMQKRSKTRGISSLYSTEGSHTTSWGNTTKQCSITAMPLKPSLKIPLRTTIEGYPMIA